MLAALIVGIVMFAVGVWVGYNLPKWFGDTIHIGNIYNI
jgi:hypothetical protein